MRLLCGPACRPAGPHLDGPSVYDMLRTYRVTATAGVPTVWMNLVQHMQTGKKPKLSDLKLIIVGGAACPQVHNSCWHGCCSSCKRTVFKS